MTNDTFRVAVTGDTGYDVYTEYVEAYQSTDKRVQKPEAAYDVYVPSGAAFTALAFRALLTSDPSSGISVDYLQPAKSRKYYGNERVFSTLQKYLLELYRFKDDHLTKKSVLRVKRVRLILDKEPQQSRDVFSSLVDKQNRPLIDKNYDLLVIHDGAGSWRQYPSGSGPVGDAMNLVSHVLSDQNLKYLDRPKH